MPGEEKLDGIPAEEKVPDETLESVFSAEETASESSPPDFDWEGVGLENYKGRKFEDIANDIKYKQKLYGDQSNEIGKLRKEHEEASAKLQRYEEVAGKSPDVSEAIEDMSEGQLADFYKEFEKNPRKALRDMMGESRRSDDDLQEIIDARVSATLEDYHTWSRNENLKTNRPEYGEHEPYIELLQSPDHFGSNRSSDELLDFSILRGKDKSLADLVYSNMKRFKGVSFSDCKRFAELERNAAPANEDTKEKLRREVESLSGVKKGSPTGKASVGTEIGSMDEAFDME